VAMKEDRLYLIHIQECIGRIESYTSSGKDAFIGSTLIQDAVIRNFEIIGEASKRLSEGLRQSYSATPWRRVAGFRDVLIHNYLGVDLDEVWSIIEHKLPELKHDIQRIIDEAGNEE